MIIIHYNKLALISQSIKINFTEKINQNEKQKDFCKFKFIISF